jgi:hypothetical protein
MFSLYNGRERRFLTRSTIAPSRQIRLRAAGIDLAASQGQ